MAAVVIVGVQPVGEHADAVGLAGVGVLVTTLSVRRDGAVLVRMEVRDVRRSAVVAVG